MNAAIRREEVPEGKSPFLFLPLPLQVETEESTVPHLLVAGAAGTAKSYGARWFVYKQCRELPGFRALLLRCTYDQLNKNHLQYMNAEAVTLGAKYSGGSVRQMAFPNDSLIFMGYCEDESDIAQHVGPEWDLIVFEEAVTFLPRAINEISARARGSATAREALAAIGRVGGQVRLLSNPGGRAMLYLQDHYITRQPDREEYPHYRAEQHGYITSTLDDNPYLGEDYEEKHLSHLSAARYKQLRYGDWSVYAGAFFGAFESGKHLQYLEVA